MRKAYSCQIEWPLEKVHAKNWLTYQRGSKQSAHDPYVHMYIRVYKYVHMHTHKYMHKSCVCVYICMNMYMVCIHGGLLGISLPETHITLPELRRQRANVLSAIALDACRAHVSHPCN